MNTSSITAIGNDYDFEEVFARPLKGLAKKGDLLVAISTYGNSPNVLRAAEVAKRLVVYTVGLAGKDGGQLAGMCDLSIVVPSNRTSRIQEAHIMIGYIMCQYIDELA